MIACVYDRYLYKGGSDSRGHQIQLLQDKFSDKLQLSGAEWLATMQGEFEKLGLWDGFTTKTGVEEGESASDGEYDLDARDLTSGNYSTHNARTETSD